MRSLTYPAFPLSPRPPLPLPAVSSWTPPPLPLPPQTSVLMSPCVPSSAPRQPIDHRVVPEPPCPPPSAAQSHLPRPLGPSSPLALAVAQAARRARGARCRLGAPACLDAARADAEAQAPPTSGRRRRRRCASSTSMGGMVIPMMIRDRAGRPACVGPTWPATVTVPLPPRAPAP